MWAWLKSLFDLPRTNAAGVSIIKEFEGLSLKAYRDTHGQFAIGYGCQCASLDMEITPDEAETLLQERLRAFEKEVAAMLEIPVTDNEFSAIVCLCYNVGARELAPSRLIKYLNAADFEAAADEFLIWDHIDGRPNARLHERRTAERALFLS